MSQQLSQPGIRDVTISGSGDIAVASMLIQASGILNNGSEVQVSVRATSCCQRSNHTWLIIHEHTSLPVDLQSGITATGLAPS
jgi:ketosteroid isomerase-like protein